MRVSDVLVDLDLVGQVGDDGAVGLEATQQEGGGELAQGTVALARLVEFAHVALELLQGAEHAGVQEVEDRPQVGEVVFHRRARERHAHARVDRLDRARLLDAGVLDGLRLVEDEHVPRDARDDVEALRHLVGGDAERGHDVAEIVVRDGGEARVELGCARAVQDLEVEVRAEALELVLPVADERRRHHEQGANAVL